MLKTIGKACISVIMAIFLSFAFWYFLLGGLPEDSLVQGTAAPTMSKDQAFDLMSYHGIKVIRTQDGYWVFDRGGQTCRLTRKK